MGIQIQNRKPQARAPRSSPPPAITPGPMEGLILVNGRPQIERADLPTISFSAEAIAELQRRQQQRNEQ